MEDVDLPGYRQRLMCELEPLETNATMNLLTIAPSPATSNQPSTYPTIHPTLNQTSDQTTQQTLKLTPWPTNNSSVIPTLSTTDRTVTNEAKCGPK